MSEGSTEKPPDTICRLSIKWRCGWLRYGVSSLLGSAWTWGKHIRMQYRNIPSNVLLVSHKLNISLSLLAKHKTFAILSDIYPFTAANIC